jgi:hypothetical protein
VFIVSVTALVVVGLTAMLPIVTKVTARDILMTHICAVKFSDVIVRERQIHVGKGVYGTTTALIYVMHWEVIVLLVVMLLVTVVVQVPTFLLHQLDLM